MSALAYYLHGCDERKKVNELVDNEDHDVGFSMCVFFLHLTLSILCSMRFSSLKEYVSVSRLYTSVYRAFLFLTKLIRTKTYKALMQRHRNIKNRNIGRLQSAK